MAGKPELPLLAILVLLTPIIELLLLLKTGLVSLDWLNLFELSLDLLVANEYFLPLNLDAWILPFEILGDVFKNYPLPIILLVLLLFL